MRANFSAQDLKARSVVFRGVQRNDYGQFSSAVSKPTARNPRQAHVRENMVIAGKSWARTVEQYAR